MGLAGYVLIGIGLISWMSTMFSGNMIILWLSFIIIGVGVYLRFKYKRRAGVVVFSR